MAFHNEPFIQQIVDVIREDVVNSDFYIKINNPPLSITSYKNKIHNLSLDDIRKELIINLKIYRRSKYLKTSYSDDDSLGINVNNFEDIKTLLLYNIDNMKQSLQDNLKLALKQSSQQKFKTALENIKDAKTDYEIAYKQSHIDEIDKISIENIHNMIQFYELAAEHVKQQIAYSSIEEFIFIYDNGNSLYSFNNIVLIYNNTSNEMLEELKQEMFDLYENYIQNLSSLNPYSIIDKPSDYYSAYSEDISNDVFVNKNMVWFTESLNQSILHPLDNSKIITNPVMFKFRLSRPINVLNGNTCDNYKIFDFISTNINTKFNELLNCSETRNPNTDGSEPITSKGMLFNIQNNKFILYIIEAINRIFCGTFRFDGYKNADDQNEIAVIHFNDIVHPDKIDKYNYLNIQYKGMLDELGKPLRIINIDIPNNNNNQSIGSFYKRYTSTRTCYETFKKESFNSRSMMECAKDETLKIIYENDTTKEKYIFDCHDKTTHTAPYPFEDPNKAKYLKYKQKYLKLKAKLL